MIAALTLGDDSGDGTAATATPTATPTRTATPTADGRAQGRQARSRSGNRPNVVVAGRRQRLRRLLPPRPHEHRGRQDRQGPLLRARRSGSGPPTRSSSATRVWVAASRSNQIVRLNARTGKPIGDPIKLPFRPSTHRATPAARSGPAWCPATSSRTSWCGSTPRRARSARRSSYPYGILSMTSSPTALWVAARRRAQIQRVDPKTGAIVKSIRVGHAPQRGHRLQPRLAVDRDPAGQRRDQAQHLGLRADPDQRRPVPAPARGQPRLGLRHELQLERPDRDRREDVARSSASRSTSA